MGSIAQVPIGEKFGSRFGQDLGFADLVSLLLSNSIVIAGIILLFLLIFGGISIIIGAGGNNPESVEKGKKAATAAAAGFAIVFASYWIIKIVEAITGLKILESGF